MRNDRKSDSNLNSYLYPHLTHSWCRVAAACATAPSLKQSSVEDIAICFGEFWSQCICIDIVCILIIEIIETAVLHLNSIMWLICHQRSNHWIQWSDICVCGSSLNIVSLNNGHLSSNSSTFVLILTLTKQFCTCQWWWN